MTNKTNKTGLAGAISVLLMLQPAAALSAYMPNGVASVEAAPTSATEELLISQRGGRGGGGSRGGGSRGGGSRSSSGRTGFSSYSGSRQGSRQSTRATANHARAERIAKARAAAPVIRVKPAVPTTGERAKTPATATLIPVSRDARAARMYAKAAATIGSTTAQTPAAMP